MMKELKNLLAVLLVITLSNTVLTASSYEILTMPDGREVARHREGARVTLPDPGDYDWWYGCSPTSAGMMMGYYDINGYGGLNYDNLVPGGVAETSTFPSTPGTWEYLAQNATASSGHVTDFYAGGFKIHPAEKRTGSGSSGSFTSPGGLRGFKILSPKAKKHSPGIK